MRATITILALLGGWYALNILLNLGLWVVDNTPGWITVPVAILAMAGLVRAVIWTFQQWLAADN